MWLAPDELVELNQFIVLNNQPPEPFGLLKPNELISACARPKNLWAYYDEERIAFLATALIIGVARVHPFVQGNKRTAFAAATQAFLPNNGWRFTRDDTEEFGPIVEDVILGRMGEDEFAYEMDRYLVEEVYFGE